MAFLLTISFFMASLLLTLLLTTTLAANDLIGDICSKTTNPSLCLQALTSNPSSANADLRGLGQISIDLAQSDAKSTLNLIGSLAKQATNAKLTDRYNSCTENYSNSISDLDEARTALNSGDPGSMNIKASAALDGATTCDDGFSTGPPAEPSQLKQANKKLQGLCSIVLVISNELPR